MFLLALLAGALAFSPWLRHATGQFVAGWLTVVLATIAFGAVGLVLALGVALVGVWRPARKPGP